MPKPHRAALAGATLFALSLIVAQSAVAASQRSFVSTSTNARNGIGIEYLAGGIAESQGNNFIYGNTVDGTAPTIVGSK